MTNPATVASPTFDRALAIVSQLENHVVRATLDPSAVNPPCVLVTPPTRTYDMPCGFRAAWTLVALAPGALGADRTTWSQLEYLVEQVRYVVDVHDAEPVSYTVNGVAYPAYLLRFEEDL